MPVCSIGPIGYIEYILAARTGNICFQRVDSDDKFPKAFHLQNIVFVVLKLPNELVFLEVRFGVGVETRVDDTVFIDGDLATNVDFNFFTVISREMSVIILSIC